MIIEIRQINGEQFVCVDDIYYGEQAKEIVNKMGTKEDIEHYEYLQGLLDLQ